MTAEPDSHALIDRLMSGGYEAMAEIHDYNQNEVDELVQAIAWAVCEDERAREISKIAVEETGFGNVEDKINKKKRKSTGTLQDLLGEPSVGVINVNEEEGLTEYAKPVGVVGAVVPSTNPGATPANLAMMALKGRNAIIISPSPSGFGVCKKVVEYIHAELEKIGAPPNLVQMVPPPVNKNKTYTLMEECDLLQVTGSANNVQHGQESGTPNYCVGEGNVVSIVDSSAALDQAAENIMLSKTFDFATSCSADNSTVIVDEVYQETIDALKSHGGYMCTAQEHEQLEETLFPKGYGSLNSEIIAKSAGEIAAKADIDAAAAKEADFLMVEGRGIGPEHPLSGEKLSVVLSVFRASDFEEALDITHEILDYEGSGHSCCLHTTNDDHIDRAGEAMSVCRVMVNQPTCYGNGGNFNNGMPFTLSMGAGTWGDNQLDENLQYTHFINITTVSEVIEATEPDDKELFGSYFAKYGR